MMIFPPIISFEASLRSRPNFSFQHMQEAIHLMKLSRDCEVANTGKRFGDGDFFNHHRAYVVGTIMTSVASVEALANEFYLDATDNLLGSVLDNDSQALLAEIWTEVDRFYILKKFQIALSAIKKNKFDVSRNPYQDVSLLINLRNMLVHFKPEWDTDPKNSEKIAKKLRGKFELNPFYPQDDPIFFPFKCLSHGCAYWAVRSCLDFIFQFFNLLGVDQASDRFKNWKSLESKLACS